MPIDLVDTVGAGDSFTSGLLEALHRADLIGGPRRAAVAAIDESTLASVVEAAALTAAITCSRPGANPPTRAEIDALSRPGHVPEMRRGRFSHIAREEFVASFDAVVDREVPAHVSQIH